MREWAGYLERPRANVRTGRGKCERAGTQRYLASGRTVGAGVFTAEFSVTVTLTTRQLTHSLTRSFMSTSLPLLYAVTLMLRT